jgi:hypothetical protein
MIAPQDFTNELQFYLYVTDHMVTQFGLESNSLSSGSDVALPRDWWSVWRSEVLITDPEGLHNVVLFTNAATLISFICAGMADDFGGVLESFQLRFQLFLQAKGVELPEKVSTSLTVMLNEPEELSDDVWWLVDCVKKDLVERKMETLDAELKLNMSPACEMGGDSPMDYFEVEFERNPLWPKS